MERLWNGEVAGKRECPEAGISRSCGVGGAEVGWDEVGLGEEGGVFAFGVLAAEGLFGVEGGAEFVVELVGFDPCSVFRFRSKTQ